MWLKDLVLPSVCAVCDALGPTPCEVCRKHLPRARPAMLLLDEIDELYALFSYEGAVRQIVTSVKYLNRRDAFGWLGAELAGVVHESDFDCVTWVPSSVAGRARRGYEPSRLLAEAVAKNLRLPSVALLRRRDNSPQTDKHRSDRLAGPQLKPILFGPRVHRVLLLDDVCTTGGSLSAAARVLKASGVVTVHAAVAATTPEHAGWGSNTLTKEFCM